MKMVCDGRGGAQGVSLRGVIEAISGPNSSLFEMSGITTEQEATS